MNDFWQHCSALLERELTPQQYVTWIKPLAPVDFDADANMLSIAAPNRFKLDWVKSQFSGRIADLARDFWHAPVDVQFVLDPKATARSAMARERAVVVVARAAPPASTALLAERMARRRCNASAHINALAAKPRSTRNATDDDTPTSTCRASTPTKLPPHAGRGGRAATASQAENDSAYERSKLNPVLTFDNFVTGKANQLARAAAIQVADNPGISYNPLFLYGGVGLGKTHLIHAIGNQLLQDKAGARIRYIHAEQYVSDVVKAYQRKAFDDFKRYYHSLDLLLIDDIQFFSGKSRTQEEFFYAFEALVANKAQVIITSDTYPKEISGIDDRLISRFDSGLTVAIEPPELEMRVAILMRKAQSEGVSLSEDVAFFVAKHLRSNVRELEGALRKILAYSRFHGREITIELTKEALKDLLTVQNRQISVENIQKTVGGLLQHQGRRHVFEEAAGQYRAAAPDRDVSGEGTDAEEPAGNRRTVRRARPHHGAARGAQDRRRAAKDAQLNHELHVLEQTLKG